MQTFRNILVIQTAFPGDIVLTTPLLKSLRKGFPGCRLTLLTTPPGRDLVAATGFADRIVVYDKNGKDRGFSKLLRLVQAMRKESFDLVVSPHRSLRSALIAFGTGARERIGYSEASGAFLYSTKVLRDRSHHEVERLLDLLSPLGISLKEADRLPELGLSRDAILHRDVLLKDLGMEPDERPVAVAPGSVWGTKSWTAEGYAGLIDRLTGDLDVKVLLLGAPSDRRIGDAIMSQCRHKPFDLVGKTSIEQLIALIDGCRLLVGNDSAPGHIAAARKIPTVTLFGPTVPAFGYAPYGERTIIIEKKNLPCRPCHHHGPATCPEKHFRCMKEITADEVFEAARGVLDHA